MTDLNSWAESKARELLDKGRAAGDTLSCYSDASVDGTLLKEVTEKFSDRAPVALHDVSVWVWRLAPEYEQS